MKKAISMIVCFVAVRVFAANEIPQEPRRLSDPLQESRTSEINLPNIPAEATTPSPTVVIPLPEKELAPIPKLSQRSIRVLVDAGHGGKDYGAHGNGISEKALCLKIGNLLKSELERLQKIKDVPFEVHLTREKDAYLTLHDRVRLANEWGADLFVSIHANSTETSKPRGFEVYFLSVEASDSAARELARAENENLTAQPIKADVRSILSDVQASYHVQESSRFAESVYQSMSRRLRANGLGVRQGPFTVLAGTRMPAVLIEVGYVSNTDDAKLLSQKSYLKRLANAISTGVMEFASLSIVPNPLSASK